jgi:phage terminase small subunit
MPTLTNPRHERFAQEYLVDLNAAAAYRRTYPRSGVKASEVSGHQLLRNAKVAARVAELQAERGQRVGISADEVLRELKTLLHSDVRDFEVDHQGQLTLRPGAPDEAWKAVASVKHRIITRGKDDDLETVREIEFRLWDKPKSVTLGMQHLCLVLTRHANPDGSPLKGAEVHVHLGDNGRGIAPPVRLVSHGNGRG